MGYEFIDHPADIRVNAHGKDIKEAFEQCAYSLMKSLFENPEDIDNSVKHVFEITDIDLESLLVNFLTEFLYIFDVDELLFKVVKIVALKKIESKQNPGSEEYYLKAECLGEKFDPNKHKVDVEVKAITYSYLTIDQGEKSTKINIIFDI